MPIITKTVSVETDVEVDIDLDDEEVIDALDDDDLLAEVERRGFKATDVTQWAHLQFVTAKAVACVRAMPNRPKELEDFFYEVHGEAM